MKKRLLGAVVLIALAVIFVPMLLPSHSNPEADSVSLKIPPQPSGEMQTRVLQVGPDGASAGSSTAAAINDPDHVATLDLEHHPVSPSGNAAPSIEATTAPTTSAPVAPAVASAPVPSSADVEPSPALAKSGTVSANAPATSAKSGPIAGGPGAAAGTVYTVNLGIYSDHASANKLVAKAKQHGFTALATPENFQGKSVLRVRVGPFSSRAQAEAARLKLKDFERVAMTIDVGVVNQAGDAPSSAIPAGQAGSWAVQLAAFSDEGSADKLRDRLRALGFDGYVDSVDASSSKLWRVRAGPFASREIAEKMRGQIAQKLKIKGDIVTQH